MSFYSTQTGAALKVGASSADPLPAPGSDTFTAIALVEDFDPIAFEQAAKFFYTLDSTAAKSIGGRLNNVEITMQVVLDWATSGSGTATQLETDSRVAGGVKRNYQIIYPDAGNRQYDGIAFVTSFKPDKFDSNGAAKEHTATIKLAFSGAITVTP